MGEQTFAHFEQVIVNVMADSPVFRSETSKAKCNHTDEDDPPNKDQVTGDEDVVEQGTHKSEEASVHQGKLILDATVVEHAIRFPTDLSLLNESGEISEISEHIITWTGFREKKVGPKLKNR